MWSMQTYPKVRKNLKFQERQSEFENSVRTYVRWFTLKTLSG